MKRLLPLALLLISASGILRADDAIIDNGAIQQQIDQAAQSGQAQVVIAPGTYRLAAPTAHAHLVFSNLKNLEIVADGVTLVFTTRGQSSISFYRCRNVTFRGATLLRDPIPFSQGHIIAIAPDHKSVDVQVSAGYPADVDNPKFFPDIFLNLFDAQGHWQDDAFGKKVERLGPDSFRFHAAGVSPKAGWQVGAPVAWRGKGATDIDLVECQDMKITGVTIKSGIGFCVHEDGGEGRNYFSYDITYGPPPPGATEKPLLASNADGFHSSSVRHGPTLENCHFEGMDDDGVAIHGKYGLVQEADGNVIIVRTPFKTTLCRPGDHLRFNDERGVFAAEARAVSVVNTAYTPTAPPPLDLHQFQNPTAGLYEKITLDQPVPARANWLMANADANGDGFVVRNCTIRYNRARNMLIKASDGLIENCTVEGGSMGGIIVTPEMRYWNEADYARNVVIRHNTLINCDYYHQPGSAQTGALTVAAFENRQFVPLPGGHQNITIEDNTFQNDDGTNILITSAQNVTIKDNHFVAPMQNETIRGTANHIDPGALITLKECSGVAITGNTLTNPGPYFKKEIDADPTASGTGFQNGVNHP
jgi:hypothetical protein